MEKYTHECPNLKPLRNWRFTAIVFIALFVLGIAYFAVLLHNANEYKLKNEVCAKDICKMPTEHDSYFYHSADDLCWCFKSGKADLIENVDFFMKHNSSSP